MNQSQLRNALGVLLPVVGMAITLGWMGRTAWCQCGGFSPWSWEVKSSHNSQHLIDPYTFTHILHGVVFFGVLNFSGMISVVGKRPNTAVKKRFSGTVKLTLACVIECLWELVENSPLIIERYRAATISLDYYGDSIANSVADVIACLAGYILASKIPWYASAAFFFATEIALLLTIRDSLILNVIMLTFPSEAILQWQSGG